MEQILNSNAGSVNSGHNNHEIVDRFRFGEEVHNLMRENLLHPNFENPEANGNSFTALLGLPANQAIELLHEQDPRESTVNPSGLPFTCYPTFPTNVALVERAAKFSVFASGEDSPQTSSVPSISGENSFKLKNEPGDYEPNPSFPALVSIPTERKRPLKRKDGETTQLKVNANKKSKSSEDGKPKVEENKESEKLPYVHVRARRGQATDSHSLAERARREKINARMKMLQELVPGCSKISGTALVLDEIINHVQSLQRQVEFLSMKLASVNPRIDFCLDGLLQAENNYGTVTTLPGSTGLEATSWTEIQLNGNRRPQHPQLCQIDLMQHQSTWDRDNNNISIFTNPENSLYSYESANSVSMRQSQLKMEL